MLGWEFVMLFCVDSNSDIIIFIDSLYFSPEEYLIMLLSLRQLDNGQLKVNPNNKQKPLINIQSLANLIDKL